MMMRGWSYRSLYAALLSHSCSLVPVYGGLFRDIASHILPGTDETGAARNFLPPEKDAVVPNHYIMFFSDDTRADEVEGKAASVAQKTGGKILWIYEHLKGVAISDTQARATMLDAVSLDVVESMEQDQVVTLDGIRTSLWQNGDHNDQLPQSLETVQLEKVPRGLDRIDQVSLPLNGQYRHRLNGTGVTVFVMDSGMLTTHTDFDGRSAYCGFDAYNPIEIDDDDDDSINATRKRKRHCVDSVNHGTHVAGTVGGRISGVAKNVNLVSVTVSDSDGRATRGSFIAGLNYILGQRKANPNTPMVVNISISSYFSKSLNRVVNRLVDTGVVVVVSAGNKGLNACLFSPASATKAITVGSIADNRLFRRDRRAFYSNHGPCVDIFAPGTRIVSASADSEIKYYLNSGTSMAAPHVAGAAALYLERDPTMTPEQVRDALRKDASSGKIWRLFNWRSVDKLLYTGNI